jgi:metal-sulfur cluster biosynthetic enzyme
MEVLSMKMEEIIAQLKLVDDPELGINVVDLGLIYEVELSKENHVEITMTLTTPGCPLHDSIKTGVTNAVLQLTDVKSVDVHIIWEPSWSPAMMSDAAKQQLWGAG